VSARTKKQRSIPTLGNRWGREALDQSKPQPLLLRVLPSRAIKECIAGHFGRTNPKYTMTSNEKREFIDVKRLGRYAAREIGTFSLKTKGPAPKEITGKYVVVWEWVRGSRKLAVDIWNDGK
jgi:hypothetical protein